MKVKSLLFAICTQYVRANEVSCNLLEDICWDHISTIWPQYSKMCEEISWNKFMWLFLILFWTSFYCSILGWCKSSVICQCCFNLRGLWWQTGELSSLTMLQCKYASAFAWQMLLWSIVLFTDIPTMTVSRCEVDVYVVLPLYYNCACLYIFCIYI